MRVCDYLQVNQGQQLNPWILSDTSATCALKTTVADRVRMAQEASHALNRHCPPNTECHYYGLDQCQICTSNPNHAQGGANVDA
jgi:hypothetical protein